MARKPRIEYEGAVYHVMSRGDRGGKILKDELDYGLFMHAMDKVCERTGWRIHAQVLLRNHFHWLLETPEANLVAGMKWFLGAYSQRFNARHGQRGHVFQGRYKAVVIDTESGRYFETVSTYIHLNPARAGLLENPEKGLSQYVWSSYGSYLEPPAKRAPWLATSRVLGNLGLKDTGAGRRGYAEFMEERVGDLRRKKMREAYKEEWKPIRHGWYVGDEGFREELLERLGKTIEGNERASYGGRAICEHDESRAEKLVRRGLRALRMKEEDLAGLRKGDERKCALAWLAHTETMASHKWISARLCMGRPSNITQYVKKAACARDGRLCALRARAQAVILK